MKKILITTAYCGLLGFTIVLNSCQDDPIVPTSPNNPTVDTTWTNSNDTLTDPNGGGTQDSTFTDPNGGGGNSNDSTFIDPTGGGGTPNDSLTDPNGGVNPNDSIGG